MPAKTSANAAPRYPVSYTLTRSDRQHGLLMIHTIVFLLCVYARMMACRVCCCAATSATVLQQHTQAVNENYQGSDGDETITEDGVN
jgi:hypothetical protein